MEQRLEETTQLRMDTSMASFADISDWNRFPLPPSFKGCIDHTLDSLALAGDSGERRLNQQQACIGHLARSPFAEAMLGRLEPPAAGLAETARLLGLIREQAPRITPWVTVDLDLQGFRRSSALALKLPEGCGINLALNLGPTTQGACFDEQLRQLQGIGAIAGGLGLQRRLMLIDAPLASPERLRASIEFTLRHGWERLTLCDAAAKLTPLGVRNILAHIFGGFPELNAGATALEFHGGNDRGFAVANAMAAIANGIQHVHGSVMAFDQQGRHVALNTLLNNYSLPGGHQPLADYAEYIGPLHSRLERESSPALAQNSRTALSSFYSGGECGASNDFIARHYMPEATATLRPASAPLVPANNRLRFIFKVSADDWHVRLLIEVGAMELDLGERVHHYVLLLLAREYCHQQQERARQKAVSPAEIDPLGLGWIERERLHKMIGDSEAQFNVKVCRATKQIGRALQSAGILDYKPVSTRVGSIRLACADFEIFKDSSLEWRVEDWRVWPSLEC